MALAEAAAVAEGPSWLTFGGTAIAAALTLLGIWITQRQTSKASRRSAEIETAKIEAAQDVEAIKADAVAYASAREIWGDLIRDLRAQIADHNADIKELRDDAAKYHREIGTLRARVDGLEVHLGQAKRQIRLAAQYIADLLRSHPNPPPTPDGMDLTTF